MKGNVCDCVCVFVKPTREIDWTEVEEFLYEGS